MQQLREVQKCPHRRLSVEAQRNIEIAIPGNHFWARLPARRCACGEIRPNEMAMTGFRLAVAKQIFALKLFNGATFRICREALNNDLFKMTVDLGLKPTWVREIERWEASRKRNKVPSDLWSKVEARIVEACEAHIFLPTVMLVAKRK
jgi:hypothetical protein